MTQLLLPTLLEKTTDDVFNDGNRFEDTRLHRYGMSTDLNNYMVFIVLFGQFKDAISVESKIIQNIPHIRVLIDKSKRAIPKASLLRDYQHIFYDYATAVEETLDYLEKHGKGDNKLLDSIGKVADRLNEGYLKGYAILLTPDAKLEENYYDYLDALEDSVYKLNEYVFSTVKDDLKYDDQGSKSQKILSSLISGYLHDD